MTFSVQRSSNARHLILRAAAGDAFPAALRDAIAGEKVKSGWIRATGILEDAQIRPLGAGAVAPGVRAIAGLVYLLHLDMPLASEAGDRESAWRGIVAFDGESGYETLGAEILQARVQSLHALVTVLDEPAAASAWSAAIEASARSEPSGASAGAAKALAAPGTTAGAAPMPPRPLRPSVDLDTLAPETGDTVDHFAFGRGDVVKSDGERLHVRVHKDGRVREIALEMLRVTALDGSSTAAPGTRHFKLERRV
jgi:hypothetical protein